MTMNEEVAERDALLRSLLTAAAGLLSEPQIFTVAGDELRGQLALLSGAIDSEQVVHRRLSLRNLSVVCRCAKDGVAYLGPVPDTDPCVNICSPPLLDQRGLVVAPISIAGRTICLLLGHPRDRVTRELRDQIFELAREASVELAKLIARLKREQETPRLPEGSEKERVTNPYGHPAVGPKEGSEKERATNPYGHPAISPGKPQAPAPREPEVVLLTRPKATPPTAERRSSLRFPVCVEVSHVSDHNFFTGFTEDLGEGGLFIATYSVFEIGHRFELELALPGQTAPWVVPCEVRWVRVYETPTGLIPGMGVQFLELTQEMREQIGRFMRKRPPLLHED